MHFQFKDVHALKSVGWGGLFISKQSCHCQVESLLLSGTHVAVFAAEIMHHHAVGIPGKCTVSYFLLADSAGLLLCNDTFNLLVENALLLHLKHEIMSGEQKQTAQ